MFRCDMSSFARADDQNAALPDRLRLVGSRSVVLIQVCVTSGNSGQKIKIIKTTQKCNALVCNYMYLTPDRLCTVNCDRHITLDRLSTVSYDQLSHSRHNAGERSTKVGHERYHGKGVIVDQPLPYNQIYLPDF